MSDLQRGVDMFREEWPEFDYLRRERHFSESSRYLHQAFWSWREAYPGAPYWVHFQTTDVHSPWRSVAPFGGLFVTPELRETRGERSEQLVAAEGRSRRVLRLLAALGQHELKWHRRRWQLGMEIQVSAPRADPGTPPATQEICQIADYWDRVVATHPQFR